MLFDSNRNVFPSERQLFAKRPNSTTRIPCNCTRILFLFFLVDPAAVHKHIDVYRVLFFFTFKFICNGGAGNNWISIWVREQAAKVKQITEWLYAHWRRVVSLAPGLFGRPALLIRATRSTDNGFAILTKLRFRIVFNWWFRCSKNKPQYRFFFFNFYSHRLPPKTPFPNLHSYGFNDFACGIIYRIPRQVVETV